MHYWLLLIATTVMGLSFQQSLAGKKEPAKNWVQSLQAKPTVAVAVPEPSVSPKKLENINEISRVSAIITDRFARYRIRGRPLQMAFGQGQPFTDKHQSEYQALKRLGESDRQFPVQWVLKNLGTGKVIAKSLNAHRNFYGASIVKLYVGAGFVNHLQGKVVGKQLQKLLDMLVVSDNRAWRFLQREIGGGNDLQGMARLKEFAQSLGHIRSRPYRGWLQGDHGNDVNAMDLAGLLQATYQRQYPGAELIWQIIHASRTGRKKGRKHLPKDLIVGGKTGTYHGMTVDSLANKPYRARVHHHALTFQLKKQVYGLVVLSDRGSDGDVATLAGGLVREYLEL